MEFLYRAMIEEVNRPKLGSSASTLGVRKGIDITVDQDGNVHLPDFLTGEKNGMSCSPTVSDLPDFAVPVEWGGTNTRLTVWRLKFDDLGSKLTAQQDGDSHISIGPSRTMRFEEFVDAIQSTASEWEMVTAHGELSHGV